MTQGETTVGKRTKKKIYIYILGKIQMAAKTTLNIISGCKTKGMPGPLLSIHEKINSH